MRIIVDLQGAQTESRYRGIGRYSLSFTRALLQQPSEHEFWVALSSQFPETIDFIEGHLADVLPKSRIRVFESPSNIARRTVANSQMAAAAEIIREAYLAELEPDLVLITSVFEGYLDDAVTSIGVLGEVKIPTAAVHYDLIPALRDGYISSPEYADFYQGKLESLKRADLLLAISNHSRSEVTDFLELPADRVVNIGAAVDERFRRDKTAEVSSESPLRDLGIKSQYVLYVPGGFDPRKNIDTLFRAYSKLPSDLREAYTLVIGSRASIHAMSALQVAADASGLNPNEWISTGYLETSRLIELYCGSSLFIFPSKHEGFGLPLLEAMTLGIPCIASSTTSVGEVMGDPAYCFDPDSVDEMAGKLMRALQDENWRAQIAEHSRSRASEFSWQKTARLAMAAIEHRFKGKVHRDAIDGSLGLSRRLIADEIVACADGLSNENLKTIAFCLASNLRRESGVKLFLDVTELAKVDGKSGIQRVVRALLIAISKEKPHGVAVQPIYFDGLQFRRANHFASLFFGCDIEADAVIDCSPGDQYLSLDLNVASIVGSQASLKLLRRKGVKLNFLIYDVLPILHPEWWPAGLADGFATWFEVVSRLGDRLLCISQAVKEDVTALMALEAEGPAVDMPRVDWFHLGADIKSTSPTASLPVVAQKVFEQMALRPTFLMVGTVEPRKGHELAFAAFEWLWSTGHALNLVVVGKRGWLVDDLANKLAKCEEQGRRFFWLEAASDEFLEELYARSTCLLAASEAEGFGLPLIEASFSGLPVLARDIPVFREVAGEGAAFFSGADSEGLAKEILGWLKLNATGDAPRSQAMKALTWAQSARAIMQLIELNGAEGI